MNEDPYFLTTYVRYMANEKLCRTEFFAISRNLFKILDNFS